MRSGATISDVAAAAGVSRATVSRVMNGSKVDAELTRRVQLAAASLDYRPSATARSLSLGRTLAVGILVPDLTNPMFQVVLRAVAEGADRAGYRAMVAETDGHSDRELDQVHTLRARTDALVLVAPRSSDDRLAEILTEAGPSVLVNRTLPGSQHPAVVVDYERAIHSVVEHLVQLGHRSIVYLSGPQGSASALARLSGLGRAQLAHPEVEFFTLAGGASMAHGYDLALAARATRATAVIAYNDLVAFGALAHFNELGIAVPEEVSVVGIDGISLSRFATPALTTVAVPYDKMGARAWERLHALITGGALTGDAGASASTGAADASTGAAGVVDTLPTELVIRASTAPPGSAPPGTAPPGGRQPAHLARDRFLT